MRTINETIDDEIYIDCIIEPKDEEALHDQSLEPIRILVDGKIINIWVRRATARELYGDGQWCDDE